jgi:apolipoprotein N-acyltransferase
MHGDLAGAAQHHILFVFAVPFLVYAYIAWAAGAIFHKRIPQLRLSFRAIGIALAVWAVFTVLRNLPFEPFSWFYV